MIQRLRVRLARWILGRHCVCYQTGYHKLCKYPIKKYDTTSTR